MFDSLTLVGLLREDPFKEDFPEQVALLQAFDRAIAVSDCNLLQRIMVTVSFKHKSYYIDDSDDQPSVELNRLTA